MESKHEDTYRRTIEGALTAIEQGAFTEQMVPRILIGLRQELGQCMELLLISPEFYAEQMAKLQEKILQVSRD